MVTHLLYVFHKFLAIAYIKGTKKQHSEPGRNADNISIMLTDERSIIMKKIEKFLEALFETFAHETKF